MALARASGIGAPQNGHTRCLSPIAMWTLRHGTVPNRTANRTSLPMRHAALIPLKLTGSRHSGIAPGPPHRPSSRDRYPDAISRPARRSRRSTSQAHCARIPTSSLGPPWLAEAGRVLQQRPENMRLSVGELHEHGLSPRQRNCLIGQRSEPYPRRLRNRLVRVLHIHRLLSLSLELHGQPPYRLAVSYFMSAARL